MINITITKSSITAEGHADYAEYGKDIISIVTVKLNTCWEMDEGKMFILRSGQGN